MNRYNQWGYNHSRPDSITVAAGGGLLVANRTEAAIGAEQIDAGPNCSACLRMRFGAFVNIPTRRPVFVQRVAVGTGALVAAGNVDTGVRASAIVGRALVDIWNEFRGQKKKGQNQ